MLEDSNNSRTLHIFCVLSLFICGALIFLFGFFPASYSTVESEKNFYLERPIDFNGEKLTIPAKQHSGVILLIIDALRMDYVSNITMPKAYGAACERLRLHVEIPTVTLPRLKSITTGTVSNFIDIALNIGHPEQLEDSLLHRIKKRGDIISFAGDHTWIQLFPSEFSRSAENYDSFYVNDFYEGDKNVTYTLGKELNNTDWTLLILHYLGLDHIGHVEGHKSGRVKYKLAEMEAAILTILNHKHFSNYLLLVTGDHGMANGGGHGGNTPEEMHVPLLLYTANCSKPKAVESKFLRERKQIDLAPTLAILLSVEIPKTSIGCLIPEMLETLSLEDQLYAYYYNALHLLSRARIKFGARHVKASEYYEWYTHAKMEHRNFLASKRMTGTTSSVQFQKAKLDYVRLSVKISSLLSESLVSFDYGFITIGLVLVVTTALHALLGTLYLDQNYKIQLVNIKLVQLGVSGVVATFLNIFCHYMDYVSAGTVFNGILLTLPITAAIYLTVDVVRALLKLLLPDQRQLKLSVPIPLPLVVCYILRLSTIGSSSFIEREDVTWYYLGNTLLILTTITTLHKRISKLNLEGFGYKLYIGLLKTLFIHRKIFVVLITLTMLRYLDYTIKFKTFLMVFSLFILWSRLTVLNSDIQKTFCAAAVITIYVFRGLTGGVEFFEMNNYAKSRLIFFVLFLFWVCILAIGVFAYKATTLNSGMQSPMETNMLLAILKASFVCLILIAALLHNPYNVVLLPAMLMALDESYNLCDVYCTSGRILSARRVHVYKVVLTIFIAKIFYFYQGNSNSLSTINLNPGYIGQSSYNPLIVGIFVTINTYCAEIIGFMYLVVHTLRVDLKSEALLQIQPPYAAELESLVVPLYAALIMLPVAFYLCLMVGFRYHLFIYSVFSPKVLYDCYSIVVLYLIFLITSLYFKIFKKHNI